jgi:hypothetical protein
MMTGPDNLFLYDNMIDELEVKISTIKKENAQFYEDIDMLNESVYQNEENNKVIKFNSVSQAED